MFLIVKNNAKMPEKAAFGLFLVAIHQICLTFTYITDSPISGILMQ